jgi:hypothetical protein
MIFFQGRMMQSKRSIKLLTTAAALAGACALPSMVHAEDLSNLDKGHRLLIEDGLQTIGLVQKDLPFHIDTYLNANYTSVLWWQGGSDPSAAPNTPWVRSVPDPTQMPDLTPSEIGAYMSHLVGLPLGDEQNLNDRTPGGTFDQTVQWFHNAQSNPAYANTILYVNNWGSQLLDQNLDNFISTAHPDMMSFDTYPWTTTPTPGGSPSDWYTWLRRYHVYAHAYNIPFGVYRQTYHSDSEGRRDPSPSEQNLNTNGALAFGATYLADFTYNTGATSLFDRYPNDPTHGAGDLLPNAIYQRQAIINAQARNLGKALVRLQPVDDQAGQSFGTNGAYVSGAHTTNMMIVQGKHLDANNNVQFNALPGGFVVDPSASSDPSKVSYSDWVTTGNDPYLNGGFVLNRPNNYGVVNKGTKNDGLPGDVIISWFKPLDESFDGPDFNDERYFMVVNGLTGPDGTAADYKQEIKLDFNFTGTTINSLQRLDENTGEVVTVPLELLTGSRYRLTLDLDGGMGALFKFNDGAPFIGIDQVPEPASVSILALGALGLMRRRRCRN